MGLLRRAHRYLARGRPRRRVLTAAVCLALTFVPLVGTLGYESGFVLGPLASLAGMGIGIDAVSRLRARPAGSVTATLALLGGTCVAEVGRLAAIAIAVLLAGGLWQPACDRLGGLVFFATGPLMCAAIGCIAGIWGAAIGTTSARARAWAFAPMLACLAIGLWRLYADPVVFAFDPFWGYFSGSVYDESVAVGPTYLRYRAYNLLAATAAVGALALVLDPTRVRLRRPRPTLRAALGSLVLAIVIVATATIGARAARFGFTADLASLSRVLSGTAETEHFVIHYAPRSADARQIEALAAEHEHAWAQLRAKMGGREPDGPVHSFLFVNPEQKRALMGAGTVQVAAPWRRQIYLDHRPFPHPVLHHELAHVFGATVGDPIFGVSFSGASLNFGLIEGFATALAPRPSDRLDLHDQAAVLDRLGKRPPMATIMGPGFFSRASQVAYTAAGSFCLWLVETRGFESLAALYRSAGDFEGAYGEPLDTLERDWLAFLAAREIRDDDIAASAQRFQRPSVFERPCAHRAAEVRETIERDVVGGRFDDAVDGYRELCSLEPERAEHKLGLAQGLVLSGDPGSARAALDEADAMPEQTVTMRGTIAERRGDVALELGELDVAVAAYEVALSLPLGEDRERVLQLKRAGALEPELAPLVRDYFAPFDATGDDLVRATLRVHAAARITALPRFASLGSYLMARQLLNVQSAELAVTLLERALAPADGDAGLPTPQFVRAARIALLEACVLTHRWERARAILGELEREPDQGRGHRVTWADWSARIDFFAEYFKARG